MTSRERVEKAFAHQEADRVPVFEQTVCTRVASEIMGRRMRTGGGRIRWEETSARWESEDAWQNYVGRIVQDTADLTRALDHDIAHIPWRHAAKPSEKLDDFTFRYDDAETDTWSIYHYEEASDVFHEVDSSIDREGVPAIERMVNRYESADAPQPPALESYANLLEVNRLSGGDRYLVSGEGMVMIPPRAAWLEACAVRPDLVERYLDHGAAWSLAAIPVAASLGIRCLWAGGDLASSAGPFYSTAMLRRFIIPRLEKIVDAAHAAGMVYLFRTDGNIWSIAQELLVDSGVDGYGEIDIDAGMELPEIKRRSPHLTLWGGVSCGKALSLGTPEQVREQVKRVMDACKPGGGLIFGSSNSIHHGVPTRNYVALHEAALEFGVYA